MANVSIHLLECIYWPGLSLEGVTWPVIRHLQVPAEPVCNFPDHLWETPDPGGLEARGSSVSDVPDMTTVEPESQKAYETCGCLGKITRSTELRKF
jgi:hypothetical protein